MHGDILITGASGFLGSHLTELLVKTRRVIILKRSFSDTSRLTHLGDKFISYDIDKVPLERVFEDNNIRAVIHMAINYGRDGALRSQVIEDNVVFPMRLLELAASAQAGLFINTDTFFNTGELNYKYLMEYTLSKRQFVEWLRTVSVKTKIVNMKLQHIFGPRDSEAKFVPKMINRLLIDPEEIQLTRGEQKRDFIYVTDVVNAYMRILESADKLRGNYEQFDVGSGVKHTIKEFMEICKEQVGVALGRRLRTYLNFGVLPYRDGAMMDIEEDISRLRGLGWSPKTAFRDALSETIKYYYITAGRAGDRSR